MRSGVPRYVVGFEPLNHACVVFVARTGFRVGVKKHELCGASTKVAFIIKPGILRAAPCHIYVSFC